MKHNDMKCTCGKRRYLRSWFTVTKLFRFRCAQNAQSLRYSTIENYAIQTECISSKVYLQLTTECVL